MALSSVGKGILPKKGMIKEKSLSTATAKSPLTRPNTLQERNPTPFAPERVFYSIFRKEQDLRGGREY